MTLELNTQIGPYEILAKIGAGGMGEVFRARDSRLGRDVAIKILPFHYASSDDRLSRFEQCSPAHPCGDRATGLCWPALT